jgi:hypothetical protein
MSNKLRNVGCLIIAGTIFGCASVPTYQQAGKYKLFVNISKGSDSIYRVDSISNEGGNVDFNNVEFTGDTSPKDCRRVVCDSKAPEFYRNKNVHPEHELGNGLGRGFDSSVSYKRQEFYDFWFRKAVAEALLTSKIDRDKLIVQYDSYVDNHNKTVDKFTVPPDKFDAFLSK